MLSRVIHKIVDILLRCYWDRKYSIYRKMYTIADDLHFNGSEIKFYGNGDIIIDEGSHIGSYSTIQSVEGYTVKIGSNCRISHNVRIYTKSEVANQDLSLENLMKKRGNVIIGDHVWIGVNCYIGPGINIGENSVVGANSVVTHNVKPYTIVGGVPARMIKEKAISI